jgi:hypothetical protein
MGLFLSLLVVVMILGGLGTCIVGVGVTIYSAVKGNEPRARVAGIISLLALATFAAGTFIGQFTA